MPSPRHKRAFTLIELLVVIAIITIIFGLIFSSGWLKKADADIQVELAANGVERKLLEARNLAISTGKPACVVFHIENKGSGAILRNRAETDPRGFPGRHWCAVISGVPRLPHTPVSDLVNSGSAQRFAHYVESLQVGERFYLPKGARFLALGDAEDNLQRPGGGNNTYINWAGTECRIAPADWVKGTQTRTGTPGLSDTYPRPWFGYLGGPGPSYTLNAFGGYDHAIYGSAFDYECSPRTPGWGTDNPALEVFDSTNTELCTCYVTPNAAMSPARNGLLDDMLPCADTKGTPRPLVNGYWLDYAIVFLPDGQARALTFYNRFCMFNWAISEWPSSRTSPKQEVTPYYGHGFWSTSELPIKSWVGRDDPIIHSLGEAIGGPVITIAKDAPDASPSFTTPRQALNSILPMRRLVISEPTGGVRSFKPFAGIQTWLDAIESNVPPANRIWSNGWVYCDATDTDANKIRVTGAVEPEMLQQHDPYPWIKPKP